VEDFLMVLKQSCERSLDGSETKDTKAAEDILMVLKHKLSSSNWLDLENHLLAKDAKSRMHTRTTKTCYNFTANILCFEVP
jgi:hypothetical protein